MSCLRLTRKRVRTCDSVMNAVLFPYAWPNRNAPTKAVLSSALMHPRFEDLVRFSLLHGTDTLKAILHDLVAAGAMPGGASEEVERTLTNIARGIARYRAGGPRA